MKLLAAGCLLAASGTSLAAGLEGSQVTVAGYCCVGPFFPYRFTEFVTATVGDGVEFPSGSIATTGSIHELIRSSIDLSAFSIDLQYTDTNTAAVAPFNGYAFDFTGLGAQRIAGVALNSLSTFTPGSIGLSFDDDSIFYNASGLSFTPESHVLIDVTLAPVPEADSMLMLGAGLGLLCLRLRRRPGSATAAR